MTNVTIKNHGIFRSARLIYRACEPSDDTALFQDLTFDRPGYTLSNYTNNRLAGTSDATHYRKFCAEKCLIGTVICLPATEGESTQPVPIGEIHLKDFGADRAHHRNSEIGLQVLEAYRGKGYASEAIRWTLWWAFHHTNLHRLGLKVLESNEAAIECYVKRGFKEEGREREALWHDGRWQDVVSMGILQSEWAEMQKGDGK